MIFYDISWHYNKYAVLYKLTEITLPEALEDATLHRPRGRPRAPSMGRRKCEWCPQHRAKCGCQRLSLEEDAGLVATVEDVGGAHEARGPGVPCCYWNTVFLSVLLNERNIYKLRLSGFQFLVSPLRFRTPWAQQLNSPLGRRVSLSCGGSGRGSWGHLSVAVMSPFRCTFS